MNRRLKLHEKLLSLFESNPQVYFQPPANIKMTYPCIRYKMYDIENRHANNGYYNDVIFYEVIVIDTDVDSLLVDKIRKLPKTEFERYYVGDNLHHFAFIIAC